MGMKFAGIMAILLLTMSASFYWYYNNSQERIAILLQNNAKLEIAVQTNEQTIKSLMSNIKAINNTLTSVNKEFSETRIENRQLIDRLSKHELSVLAANKPALVEGIVNNASDKALRCFELLSGSPLTDKEKDAKDAKSFNSECPWLWANIIP
jgi:regulator of replication initiation timing